MQISEMFVDSCSRFPEKTVLVWEDGEITYHQLYQMTVFNALRFKKAGIRPGDHVLLYAANGPEFLAGYFALQFIGALPAPTNPSWKLAEIEKACSAINCPHIVTTAAGFEELSDKLSGVKVIPILFGEQNGERLELYPKQLDDPTQIRFTSGTTGDFKGVLLSQRNILWRCLSPGTHYTKGDVFLCPIAFPFRIVKVMTAISLGACIVSMKAFSIKSIAAILRSRKITWIWASPAVYSTMTDVLERDAIRSVRGVSSLGAYLPVNIQERFQDHFGVNIYQQYGLSEGMEAVENPVGPVPRMGSPGRPCEGVRLFIDSSGGDEGEIVFAGPNVMIGYISRGPDGMLCVDTLKDGLLRTGDIGRLDEEGYLYVTGRQKRLINVDGLKVSPYEIEDTIYKFPGVGMVKVLGVPDHIRGEVPIAYIVMKNRSEVDRAMLRKHCMERLSNYKVPKDLHFVDEIPIYSNGKLG